MNQDLTEIAIAALADSIQLRLAAGRVLLRHQTHPRRKLSSLAEGCPVADRSYDRRCDQRPDARDLSQSQAGSIARGDPFYFVVHLHNLKLQFLPFAPQHRDQVPHPWGEVLVCVLKHLGYGFPQPNRALRKDYAALQQKGTNLVDHRSSSSHQPVTHSVQRLQVELIIGLDRDEVHVLPSYCFRDRFSLITGVDDLNDQIGAAQRFMPGIRLERRGDVRQCQGTVLAEGVALTKDNQERGRGTNVYAFGAGGKIESVTGFWAQ